MIEPNKKPIKGKREDTLPPPSAMSKEMTIEEAIEELEPLVKEVFLRDYEKQSLKRLIQHAKEMKPKSSKHMDGPELRRIGEWLNTKGCGIDLNDDLWMEEYDWSEHKTREICQLLFDFRKENS